jgi:hypothetical protein
MSFIRQQLDAVRVEVLQLEAILEEDPPDEPLGGDGEAALVEGHERDHVPRGRTQHRLLPRHLPLHSGGEWRELSGLDKVEQLVMRHVASRPVRHGSGEVSSELVAQAMAALRMRKSEGSKAQGQRKTMRE